MDVGVEVKYSSYRGGVGWDAVEMSEPASAALSWEGCSYQCKSVHLAGLSHLLHEREKFGTRHDLK